MDSIDCVECGTRIPPGAGKCPRCGAAIARAGGPHESGAGGPSSGRSPTATVAQDVVLVLLVLSGVLLIYLSPDNLVLGVIGALIAVGGLVNYFLVIRRNRRQR